MTAKITPAARQLGIAALLLAAACEQAAPIPVTYVPQSQAPAAAGTQEQQAARRLDRALAPGRAQQADPYAGSMAGVPTPGTDLEIGGGDPGAGPPQIAIPFR